MSFVLSVMKQDILLNLSCESPRTSIYEMYHYVEPNEIKKAGIG